MLKDKIQEQITAALKNKESEKVETLRLLMADIKNAEIDTGEALSDDDVLKIIKKNVKKLNEANEMFASGGRDDLVEQNKDQIEIYSEYLPEELSDEELEKAIDAVIAENKEVYEKSPKAIIGIAMKKLSSQADPKRIMAVLNKKS